MKKMGTLKTGAMVRRGEAKGELGGGRCRAEGG